MVIVNSNSEYIEIPKLLRCRQNDCNIYLLILHSNYTKDVWVFKVRDFRFNDIRYLFYMEFPEGFCENEYNYYLVSYDDKITEDLITSFPQFTNIQADKYSVTFNDMFLIVNNKIIVTNKFKAILTNECNEIKFDDYGIKASFETPDKSSTGDLVTGLCILNSGLLKYHTPEKICCDNSYNGNEKSRYIQYRKNG